MTKRKPEEEPSPYLLDDLLARDGVSLYDDRPWVKQAEEHRPSEEEPDDRLHFVHTECQDDGRELLVTHCRRAVSGTGGPSGDAPEFDPDDLDPWCPECLRAPACPVCGVEFGGHL